MSRPKNFLRQAFVVTVAVSGAFACNSVTTFSECPANQPAWGAACPSIGDSCSYGEDSCGSLRTSTCGEDGTWTSSSGESCNPPFPEPPTPPQAPCPSEVPEQLSGCPVDGQICTYTAFYNPCDEWFAEAFCNEGQWDVVEGWNTTECNPPPAECPIDIPVVGTECVYDPNSWDGYPSGCAWETQTPCGVAEIWGTCAADENGVVRWGTGLNIACQASEGQCGQYDAEAGCGDDVTCQWLAPSCNASGNNVVEGCYAATDCSGDPDACGAWGNCTKVSYDPCHNASCQSCASEKDVCLPEP